MFRRHIPDLDVLDSPIISPTVLSATNGGIPGSAIAERIFNDPNAWGTVDDDEEEGEEIYEQDVIRFGGIMSEGDPMAWLAEEFEKFRSGSSHSASSSSSTSDDEDDNDTRVELKPFQDKYRLTPKDVPYNWSTKWEGVKHEGMDALQRPISLASLFDKGGEDFSKDIQQQLSQIMEGGEGTLFRPFPSSPPSSSGSTSTASSSTSPRNLQIDIGVPGENSPPTPIISPVAVYSASTTLSFLEWYGIYPDSPRLDKKALRKSLHALALRQQQQQQRSTPPVLQAPTPPQMRSSPLTRPQTPEEMQDTKPTVTLDLATPVASTKPLVVRRASPEIARRPSPEITRRPSPEVARRPSPERPIQFTDPFLPKPPSRRESPIPPPGLSQHVATTEISATEPSLPKPPTASLPPIPPPSYTSCPSPRTRSRSPAHYRVSSEQIDGRRTPPTKAGTVPVETPIRRLPSIPGTPSPGPAGVVRIGTPPLSRSATAPTPPARTNTPPSLPSTPEPTPRARSSTPCAGMARPLSSVRSPPAGPRSRSMIPQHRGSHSVSLSSSPDQMGGCLARTPSGRSTQVHRPPALRFASLGNVDRGRV